MTQLSAQLAASIRSERAGVQALVEVLTVERNALGHGHTDSLTETASRKRETQHLTPQTRKRWTTLLPPTRRHSPSKRSWPYMPWRV